MTVDASGSLLDAVVTRVSINFVSSVLGIIESSVTDFALIRSVVVATIAVAVSLVACVAPPDHVCAELAELRRVFFVAGCLLSFAELLVTVFASCCS